MTRAIEIESGEGERGVEVGWLLWGVNTVGAKEGGSVALIYLSRLFYVITTLLVYVREVEGSDMFVHPTAGFPNARRKKIIIVVLCVLLMRWVTSPGSERFLARSAPPFRPLA